MTTNVSMSSEQLRELVTSLTSAALQAATSQTPPISFASASFSYDGIRDTMRVEEFLSTAAVYKSMNKITDKDAIQSMALILKGEAATWWLGEKDGVKTWTNFENRLRHAFAPKKPAYMIYQEIFACKQPADMLTESFIANNRALLAQLPAPGLNEEQQMDMLYGQLHIQIRERVQRNTVATFEQLLNAARGVEQLLREKPSTAILHAEKGKTKKPRCDYCRHLGHTVEICRKRIREIGHQSTQPVNKGIVTTHTQAPSPSQPVFSCYGCGAPGVVRSKCPTCMPPRHIKTEPNVDFCSLSVKTDVRQRPIVGIGIYDITGTAYVDTCAKSSVASYELYKCLTRKGCHFAKQTITITLADGVKKRQDILSASVPVNICNRTIRTSFIVLPESRENKTLLGVGFIQDAGMVINIPQLTWHFVDRPNVTYNLGLEDLEGMTMAHINSSSVEKHVSVPSTERAAMFRNEPTECVSTAEQVMASKRPRYVFDGTSPDYVDHLYADAVQSIEEAHVQLSPKSASLFPGVYYTADDIGINCLDLELVDLGPNLVEEEKRKLVDILETHSTVFLPSKEPTTLAEHSIDTGTHAPLAVPPYRLSPLRREMLKTEITKMLNEGVIESSISPWSAPIVMVPKKDGSIRLCVDYRRLNAITVPESYPMPRVDDLLQEAKPTTFMTTLDLRAGYWQVKVRKEDQDKTSFITPFGIYKFIRMPFGLRNAPATFQRMIDRVKVLVGNVKILAYLDDLIILSSTFKEHLEDLSKVLKILKEYNLSVNIVKCHFCCTTIKYLGHYITPHGLQVDSAKVEAITEIPRPKNLKQLLSFIQTCSWYRRFIPNFSVICEPLTRMTKKNAQWTWNESQERAFNDLKLRLTTAPILQQADESKPYTIKTDASNIGIGAVLVQGESDKEHPIEYASRLLTSAEKNYSTTEREALAVVWALEKFRGYVEGAQVTVLTDHQALRWLMALKSPTGRLARWALLIQAYDVTIKYTPGRTNAVADALSRLHCTENVSECEVGSLIVELPSRGPTEIRQEQLKDNHIKRIIQALEADTGEDAIYWSGKGYIINNGVLYKYNPDGDEDDAQLIVPEHEWKNVLAAYHDDPLAGHYGADKTHQRIARRYYWKGMRKFVEAYVKNCISCQRYKPSNLKPAGLLQTTASNQRFETLSFDLFGPLPTTSNGKNWILIVEDVASGWIELFALETANAETCAMTLINEVFLRYGMPRRLHSDNGPQFISAVMQKVTYCLGIKHTFTPIYHPAANPVERKNRDLKTQLAILVQEDHRSWADKLSCIRFAMNTVTSLVTGYTPAYLTFARELRTPDDTKHDLKQVVLSENFVPEITPKLLLLAETLKRVKETRNDKEEARKEQADKTRRPDPGYDPGDLVLANVHAISRTAHGVSAKLAPRRDGPYLVKTRQGATSYILTKPDDPETPLGTFHTSALTRFQGDTSCPPNPVQPIRKRGRPKKKTDNQPTGMAKRPGRPKTRK